MGVGKRLDGGTPNCSASKEVPTKHNSVINSCSFKTFRGSQDLFRSSNNTIIFIDNQLTIRQAHIYW